MSTDNTYKELLEKLIAGSISDKELWTLEKASLDDPMLADALEGYHNSKVDSSELIALKKKINRKNQKPKTRSLPIRWVSIAASLLILFGASLWMFHGFSDQESSSGTIAMKKSSPVEDQRISTTTEAKENEDYNRPVYEPEQNTKTQSIKDRPTPQPSEEAEQIAQVSTKKVVEDKKQTKEAVAENNQISQKSIKSRKANVRTTEKTVAIRESSTTLEKDLSDNENYKEAVIAMDEVQTVERKQENLSENKSEDNEAFGQASAAPAALPSIITGVVRDKEGTPLPGVKIMDAENKELANTDSNGNFELPNSDGYLITAFMGYDSQTVAISPNLVIELQESSKKFSEPHKRLVDMMDDSELINHYTNQLNSLFSKHWPVCNTSWQNNSNNPTSLSLSLKINEQGLLEDFHHFSSLSDSCRENITQILEQAESTIFEQGRPVSFMFRVNL